MIVKQKQIGSCNPPHKPQSSKSKMNGSKVICNLPPCQPRVSRRTRSIPARLLSVRQGDRWLAASQSGRVCPTSLNCPLFSARLTRKLRHSGQSCRAVCPQVGIQSPSRWTWAWERRGCWATGLEEFSSATCLARGNWHWLAGGGFGLSASMAHGLLFWLFVFLLSSAGLFCLAFESFVSKDGGGNFVC